MAGRTPTEALRKYHDDLKKAFLCLKTFSRVEFSTPSRAVGATCSWLLIEQSDDVGITLPGCGLRFEASQTLRIEECDPAKYGDQVRLRTVAYDYSVSEPGKGELWAMHWHPGPSSKVDYPHMHMRQIFGRDAHLATSRLLVEHAIHWAIEGGATPRYPEDEWQARLQETIRNYLGESSWSVTAVDG